MEIMSPASLWKDFDRKRLPLDINKLNCYEANGYRVSGLYYNALKVDDGYVRVYAKLYEPLHIQDAPVIIYFNDIHKSIEERSTMREALSDYAFLCVDYAGYANDRERFTIYPYSLSKLNYFNFPSAINEIPSDIKKTGRYIWAIMAKRAITLIEEVLPRARGIGIIGVGQGGCPAVKACSFERSLAGGMTIYSAGYISDDGGKPVEYTSFKAALNCESYGPYISVPLLVQISSNERNGSLDYMNDVFGSITNEKCRFSIVERSNRSVSVKQRKNCKFWFDYQIKGEGDMPKLPTINARSSDGRLYLETEVDRSTPVASVELFVSQGVENSAYRNWSGNKMEMISENNYLAKVPVYDIKTPLYAFVNVKYEKGISLSCPVAVIQPDTLGVKAEEIKPSRLIYESDMELDDWTVLNDSGTDEEIKLSMETGPFDIMGVASATKSISTFKISERVYKSFSDSALQLLMYSPVMQEVIFSIIIYSEDNGSFSEYCCTKKLSPADNWTSITLSVSDFKSSGGNLESFKNAATFEIKSKVSKVLISSMLWV